MGLFMCGICGWLNTEYQIDIETFKQMNNIVKHRGPDDEGYALVSKYAISLYRGTESHNSSLPLFENVSTECGFLAMGHRRLSILDLSEKGHQPMCSDDGRFCVTFNGEIYNYIEVRRELIAKGYMFRSGSDTEVLLAAYREWGERCVERFNGMWGFAIWDAKKGRLFCSRDRLGAKPFYYYQDDENFMFSSELKQLCKNPIVPREMNDQILVTYVMWGLSDYSDECWLKHIKELRGGFNLVIDVTCTDEACRIEQFKVYPYWDVNTCCEKNGSAIADTMAVYADAVKIRTRSDVPIGIMLSGGLDSSALVAEASEYFRTTGRAPSEINTFTSCYEDFHEGDEREFAHAVNEYCGTTENFIYPDEEDTLSAWEKMIWHQEGETGISALGAFLLLREIGKTGLKVMLNGQGADETMFGYERYYAWYLNDVFDRENLCGFIREWQHTVANSRLSYTESLAYMLYFLNYSVRKTRNYLRIRRWISPYTLNLFKEDESVRRYVVFKNLEELQYNELRNTQLTHILREDDRRYMAFSIESRVPFIDYRYIECAIKIPERLKIVDGYTKYPLRKYIESKLPKSVVWRKNKMGWPSPRKRWIDRFDRKRIAQMLKEPKSAKYFDVSAICALWENDPYHYAIEAFLNVEIFMRLFDAA